MNNPKQGSAFVVVVGVLGVILFASSLFMTSTIDEGRHTAKSVKGIHSTCLAEAAIERVMSVVASEANSIDPKTTDKDSLAVLLRLPAKIKSGDTLGLTSNIGADELLVLSDDVKKEIVFNKDDLQKYDTNKELDKLVEYMTAGGAEDYTVEIKMQIEKAFNISAGSEFPTYKVPGVEIGWNLRPDVKKFLNGDGYSFFALEFPSDMTWLSFSIPVEVAGITLININITGIVDKIFPDITINGTKYGFKELTSLDFFADMLINKLFKAQPPFTYPFVIEIGKIIPPSIAGLWPSGVSVDTSKDVYLEKYGQLKIECEATITYKDGYTSKRRISAVKGFKVADCEPPAPMYSLFISNLANDYLAFNNYGGQFIVNNYDFAGVWGEIKDVFTSSKNKLTADQMQAMEIPGLIRVNYKDTSTDGTAPLLVNASLVGDPNAPKMAGNGSDNFATNILTGMDAMLLLCTNTRMAVAGGKYNVNAQVTGRVPQTSTSVPSGMAGNSTTTPPSPPSFINRYEVKVSGGGGGVSMNGTSALLKALSGASGINLVPNVGAMSTNIISLAITLALKPMVDGVVPAGIVSMPDCFQKWDMPYMGTANWLYTLPSHGLGQNKTHLFGNGSLYPTLTREIEGNVMKRYRRWKMCIVGMAPQDKFLPFPPYVLPFPIPIWYTQEILSKYDYNLESLKTRDENDDMDLVAHEYDPGLQENMPPNLYTNEQYAKKASYYYKTYADFIDDYSNRVIEINGKSVFVLNGISYISGSMGDESNPFNPNSTETDKTFYVTGKGMIICSGNMYLGCDIKTLDMSAEDRTIYSTIMRGGALLILDTGVARQIEGSLYTDQGIYIQGTSSLRIIGNWVTNKFNKAAMDGKIVIDYVSSKVRSSLGSLHPERGKFDPSRYNVSFSPTWSSWREGAHDK